MAGGEALLLVKTFYSEALSRMEELCAPYAQVIDIDTPQLPTEKEIENWTAEKLANTLRHNSAHPDYNPNFRQLFHVAYKIAVEHYPEFTSMLEKNTDLVGQQVYDSLYHRHIKRLFNTDEL